MTKQTTHLTTTNGIQCCIRRHTRAKHLRITVKDANTVTITIPRRCSIKSAQQFLNEKEQWIKNQIAALATETTRKPWTGTKEEYDQTKELARDIISKKIEYFNQHYGFDYKRIAIKNQQTVWGSCSHKKNLNFSYRCIYLPEECLDYIVIHELCHLEELNHGPRFWRLVEECCPDHKSIRKTLRQYH